MGVVWDGIIRVDALEESRNRFRQELADAAKRYDWSQVTTVLRENPDLVNTTRPGGSSLYVPLHQAAHGGAPVDVVQELVDLGAWRTLQNARGERPVDVAERRGHRRLRGILEPQFRRHVPNGVLLRIQAHFHEVILGRAADEVRRWGLRLPDLEPLLELERQDPSLPVWFAVPGMYGGFAYHLRSDGVEAVLVSESWCRVVEGSGQRHEITSSGSRLAEEGFV